VVEKAPGARPAVDRCAHRQQVTARARHGQPAGRGGFRTCDLSRVKNTTGNAQEPENTRDTGDHAT
jgi:hypothetical protein